MRSIMIGVIRLDTKRASFAASGSQAARSEGESFDMRNMLAVFDRNRQGGLILAEVILFKISFKHEDSAKHKR